MRVEAIAAKLRDAACSPDRRHLDPGHGGDRRRAVGHQGQSAGADALEAARRRARPHPTYASGALRRGLTLDYAVTAAGRLVEMGYRQIKTQLGCPGSRPQRPRSSRPGCIREAVGPDIDLMCDINQLWRPEQAIEIGQRIEHAGVGLFWLEDVTSPTITPASPGSPTRSRPRWPAASTCGASCRSATCWRRARWTSR